MKKILFIDRDGTLVVEPPDEQIDSLTKLELVPHVIPALLSLRDHGFRFVMVTNQDGLGTDRFSQTSFQLPHQKMLAIFLSQGIAFEDILICPHLPSDNCLCRKPHLGLVRKYLTDPSLDLAQSAVIGDRESDLLLAQNMGLKGFRCDPKSKTSWPEIASALMTSPRKVGFERKTSETKISGEINLDGSGKSQISTGIGFFDHMLEQLSKHSGFDVILRSEGDTHVDFHHSVEDVGLSLGDSFRRALGDKFGIGRYGFVLAMDESQAHVDVALDLSGRPVFTFQGEFRSPFLGQFPTEMVTHFFRSFAQAAGITLQMKVEGENTHHMVEALFKGLGRALAPATLRTRKDLPSTKGTL